MVMGWKDGLDVRTLASKLARLSSNPDPAINCHPGISQAGSFVNMCAVPWIDIKLASHLPALVVGR